MWCQYCSGRGCSRCQGTGADKLTEKEAKSKQVVQDIAAEHKTKEQTELERLRAENERLKTTLRHLAYGGYYGELFDKGYGKYRVTWLKEGSPYQVAMDALNACDNE